MARSKNRSRCLAAPLAKDGLPLAENLVVYMVVHQPRRLRLPAHVVPAKTAPEALSDYLFSDALDRHYFEQVGASSYLPTPAIFTIPTPRPCQVPSPSSHS